MNTQTLLLITTIAFSCNSYGFDLFDPDRGKPPPPPKPKTIKPPPQPKSLPTPFSSSRAISSRRKLAKRPLPPQKDFFLKGTSIIGDKRAAILKGPDGKEFVQFLGNAPTPIENYSDYHLLKVEPGNVRIEYPAESPCRKDNEKQGIKCSDDGKTAFLTLTAQKALPPRKPPQSTAKKQPTNTKKRPNQRTFKRRVIKDEDVPPGMRVVRAPFGDRLVPIK